MSRSPRSPMPWPAYPDIPIYLDTTDERATAKTYGTTPTTPTTPDIKTTSRPTHLSPSYTNAAPVSPVEPSPTTTIETSSHRSSIWPIPEPPPEIQNYGQSRRPALRFFPTQRPRVRLESGPTLQIPVTDEKSPINSIHPGLGIMNGPPKPPSIEISAPAGEEDVEQSPNLAERIEKRLYQYSISGNIVKRWLLEIISWFFSAICMAAVIGVLVYFKDDPLSKWSSSNWALAEKTGLTLNAYISVLSKMAGAALILPVSEALGQLKWSWFQQNSKQMWDFEIFDNASRGPWGSFLLLIRTKGRALAALGAMITLAMMLLDPFFQQVVSFPERWALQDLPSQVPKTTRYIPTPNDQYIAGSLYVSYDNDLKQVTDSFAYGNGTQPVPFGNGTRPDIPLSCPTSKCSWPLYDTLGVCSQCEDVSSLLTFACLNVTVDWTSELDGLFDLKEPYSNSTACGYYLNATSENPILMSGYLFDPLNSTKGEALLSRTLPLTDVRSKQPYYGNGTIHFKDLRNTIADVIIVSAQEGSAQSVYDNLPPIARECALSWCVKTIRSSYDWGKYNEEIIATYTNTSAGAFPWDSIPYTDETGSGFDIAYTQDINIYNMSAPADDRRTTFGTSNDTVVKIQTGFRDIFPSYTTVLDVSGPEIFRFRTAQSGAPYTKFLEYNPWLRQDVPRHMERLATAMTNVIRSAPSKEMLPGEAFSSETWVSVRWEWLTLPIGLLFLSFIFLAATIFKSSLEKEQLGVLKNSAILTLLYGIPDDMRTKLTRSSSRGTPRAKAKELKVKLNPNMGWRVSGNLFSPIRPKPPQPPPGWF